MAENDGGATRARAPTRPTIALPPRTSGENMFAGGADASPGPMTLVSSFFSENDPDSEYRSFSQLLAGAMGSPVAVMEKKPSFSTEKGDKELEEKESGDGGEKEEKDFRFTQNRSSLGLVVAQPPMFTVPPGLSPTSLFESPRFFTPGQLLTGAMGSSALLMEKKPSFSMENGEKELKDKEYGDGGDKQEKDFRFTQNRPLGLMVAQSSMFTIPPGLSPTSLFESPRLFTPGQGPFGMSHQQALAQVTAQAAQSQSQFHMPNEYPSSMLAPPATSSDQQPSYGIFPVQMQNPRTTMTESSVVPYSDQRAQPPLNVDKPADDGYNWRKYGQKQVKGSEFPRSYYKCTHPNCPVKKKVERSLDGHVTEIIYKGQHNHQPPQHIKRSKDGSSNGKQNLSGNPEMGHQDHGGNLARSNQNLAIVSKFSRDQESSQATPEQLSGSSDGEEVGDAETRVEEDEDQPDPKRRNTEVRVYEPAASHRAVTEPRIIVQTTSEVDLLDDGYRWRKYGQKVVKGNPHPRSYYKCTSTGCNVRKHVERAATDIKAVITTYEGKHNHDVPAAKNSSHNTANSNVPQIKPQNPVSEKHALVNKRDFGGSDLRFKEEQVT